MEKLVVAERRKRARSAPLAPLRCHVVDDHCDALKHIHAAIRRRALPFEGVSMMHWDAHPDLMVPPNMAATACFCPQELYDALSTSEGGIAEWILPMVFQGHLSKLWWIRPPWARQFMDGDYRFSVGKVEDTGMLRVSSTAPYFVDDCLYCPEESMKDCKPVHLFVSTAREEGTSGSSAPAITVKADTKKVCEVEACETRTTIKMVRPFDSRNHVGAESANGKGPSPWVLDICLDYFTCENPFILELESRIGKDDADLVRAFYQSPMFRGATTALPHDVQVEHERLFKSEVERLLNPSARMHPLPPETNTDVKRSSTVGCPNSSFHQCGEMTENTLAGKTALVTEKSTHDSTAVGFQREMQEEEGRGGDRARELQRLEKLFSTDGDDRSLPGKFASMIGRIGAEERKLVAWVDHCACLPRYLSTREEVSASVRRAEAILVSEMGMAESRGWSGRPGVVTVARSVGDGYVPVDMVGFVEGEVLAMLKRLFGDGADPAIGVGGMEVIYEDGMEHE